MPGAKALLLLKPRYIGDAVLALPLLDVLLESYADVAVCASPWLRPVFQGRRCGWLDPPPSSVGGQLRWARSVREGRFEAAYLANRSFRSALLVRLAKVPRRIGHATEARSWLLTHTVPHDPACFEADALLSLADSLGSVRRGLRPSISLEAPFDGLVRVQPGARHAWKRPPWGRLSQALRSAGLDAAQVELVGGPSELEHCRQFAALHDQGARVWIGGPDLEPTLARLAASKAFVAGDTGLVHLAAALGVPTLAFVAPRLAPKWGWQGERNITLPPDASPESVAEALQRILASRQ
ncbi:MAG: glycosyltransferase family 9 protein [Fimbriimonadales bacterium]|nr:glycosyltransferase family 9 protein [Fimbriimonadales bacterium]